PGPATRGRRRARRPWLSGPGTGPRLGHRAPPLHGHLRPRGHLVRVVDRPTAVWRGHRAGNVGACGRAGPCPALSPEPGGDSAPGGVLPALPAEEPMAALLPCLRPANATALLRG